MRALQDTYLVLRLLCRANGLSSTFGGRLLFTVTAEWLRKAYVEGGDLELTSDDRSLVELVCVGLA